MRLCFKLKQTPSNPQQSLFPSHPIVGQAFPAPPLTSAFPVPLWLLSSTKVTGCTAICSKANMYNRRSAFATWALSSRVSVAALMVSVMDLGNFYIGGRLDAGDDMVCRFYALCT